MASITEIENRVAALEAIILGAVPVPVGFVDIDETKITDKTGWMVSGDNIAGINSGKKFQGFCTVANPTLDAHFSHFVHQEI